MIAILRDNKIKELSGTDYWTDSPTMSQPCRGSSRRFRLSSNENLTSFTGRDVAFLFLPSSWIPLTLPDFLLLQQLCSQYFVELDVNIWFYELTQHHLITNSLLRSIAFRNKMNKLILCGFVLICFAVNESLALKAADCEGILVLTLISYGKSNSLLLSM